MTPNRPTGLLADLRALLQGNPEAVEDRLYDLGLRALSEGRNNRVYA